MVLPKELNGDFMYLIYPLVFFRKKEYKKINNVNNERSTLKGYKNKNKIYNNLLKQF